jgi:uncharacterized protein YkwD
MTNLVLLLVLGGGVSREQQALDLRMDKALGQAVRRGAAIYNTDKDPAGCARLFEGALLAVRPLLDHRPALQKEIDRGLGKAERQATWEDRAFALRAVIDKVRDELDPPKPGDRKVDETKTPGFEPSDQENTVFSLTNKERARNGLAPLKANVKLFEAARAHSANMARRGRLDHTLDGKGPGERLQAAGYESAGWAENCAAGQRSAEEALISWMGSPGHRSNILAQQYLEIGIGIAPDGNGGYYWTQVFGTPAR